MAATSCISMLPLKCRDNADYFLSELEKRRLFGFGYQVLGLVTLILFSNPLKLMNDWKGCNCVSAALEAKLGSWNFLLCKCKCGCMG